ncbi:hypothetical protein [Archangium sp.]|jgi:hypothetical protein|uniref:hypothetical protein n=1 Tax=Archangium sp. TaxID=1872627 RepID=UPI002EDB0BD3
MRRRVLIALLAFGTLAGYSSGFASLYRWHRYGSPYGGCHHGRGYDYNYNSHRERWAPPPTATPPAPQAQAPAIDAPAEPGPR